VTQRAPSSASGWARGLSWNFVALAFAAVAGLTANVLLAKDFGPTGLGVFSQTLTWFALMAQVAALGVHYAVLHQTAIATTLDEAREAVDAGVTVVAFVATVAAAISFLAAPAVSAAVDSPALVHTIRFASIALVFHALAKVIAAGLNGSRRMTAFSSVAAARAAGMLISVLMLGATQAPVGNLGLVFVASEAGALVVAVIAWGRVRPVLSLQYPRYLARFGVKAAIAAITVEANSRIDIAVLGIAASDKVVGVYTLAATAFEGTFQIFVVLRNQVNPTVAAAVSEDRPDRVDNLFRQLRPWMWLVSGGVLAIATLALVPLVGAFGLSSSFVEARGPLIILLAGLVVAAPLLPFDQLLVVGGQPGAQSRIVVTSLCVNLTLSVALVPWLGGIGAAIGTVSAILMLVVGVSRGGRRVLGTTFGLWPSLPPRSAS
jgi:O-antigen/teichoic acid export membrane protein